MPLKSLGRDLQGDPSAVYLIFGAALPLVETAVGRIRDAVLPTVGIPAFNHASYRAGEGGGQALSTCRTPPMMSGRRLVELRDLENAPQPLMDSLEAYLRRPSPGTVLVVSGSGMPKPKPGKGKWAKRLASAAGKGVFVLELGATAIGPARFARAVALQQGKRMEPAAASLLVEVVGTELTRIEREVDKLCSYVGEQETIRAEHVTSAASLTASIKVWDLTAAIASGDAAAALLALQRLSDDEPRRLLSMVVWQARTLLAVAEGVRAGQPDSAIARSARVRHDVLQRIKSRVDRIDDPDVLMRRLAEAHLAMNSARVRDVHQLERLVIRLTEA
jgi:DNA polymerase III subunit delta